MSVAFKELGGSPVERYSSHGFGATREFLVAWEDRDAFAIEVLGEAAVHGGNTWVNYPSKPSVFATKLQYEPFDPDNPDQKVISELTEGLNSYSNSFAKATVTYQTVNVQDREDGPVNEIGTHLTYKMNFSMDCEPIAPSGWVWSDNSVAPSSANFELLKRMPVTEHELTWHQVINPPWGTIQEMQGKVNQYEFLGCPAETVLFEGAEANKLFRAGFAEGESAFCWKIRFLFRERSIKQCGSSYGWNHFFRANPFGWQKLVNSGSYVYDSADFLSLFVSADG